MLAGLTEATLKRMDRLGLAVSCETHYFRVWFTIPTKPEYGILAHPVLEAIPDCCDFERHWYFGRTKTKLVKYERVDRYAKSAAEIDALARAA